VKEIKLFMFDGCPHCKLAIDIMHKIIAENPQYKNIKITMIDEHKQPDIADKYDYYYVPTFYVGETKIHEGHAELKDVEYVFKLAYAGQSECLK
jgi:thioredoxin 1